MLTSSTNGIVRPLAMATMLAVMAGCATSPDLDSDGQPHESKYAEQREGAAAGASDAVHVPPVPHTPEAEQAAQEALPEYVAALQAIRAEKYEKAQVMLQSLSSRFPQLSGPLVNQGIVHMELEQYEDAEDRLREALEVNRKNPYAHNALGVALREQGRFDESMKHYREALSLDPKYARAHFNMGVLAELYMQDMALALQHFRAYQNLQKEPDQSVANWITDLERRVPDPVPPWPGQEKPAPGSEEPATGTASDGGTDLEAGGPDNAEEAS